MLAALRRCVAPAVARSALPVAVVAPAASAVRCTAALAATPLCLAPKSSAKPAEKTKQPAKGKPAKAPKKPAAAKRGASAPRKPTSKVKKVSQKAVKKTAKAATKKPAGQRPRAASIQAKGSKRGAKSQSAVGATEATSSATAGSAGTEAHWVPPPASSVVSQSEPSGFVQVERETLGEFVRRRAADGKQRAAAAPDAPGVEKETPQQATRMRIAMRQLMQAHYVAKRHEERRERKAAAEEAARQEQAREERLRHVAGISVGRAALTGGAAAGNEAPAELVRPAPKVRLGVDHGAEEAHDVGAEGQPGDGEQAAAPLQDEAVTSSEHAAGANAAADVASGSADDSAAAAASQTA